MKIYLIGMPYSGKSTLGKQLAEELQVPFVDLDFEIEKREKKSIPEIFSQDGEDYFRITESTVLKEWAASSTSFVMATGGGAPCFHGGIEAINHTGISIFLDVPVHDLVERVGERTDRPLLNTKDQEAIADRFTSLYSNRLEIYKKASIHLSNPTLQTLLKALQSKSKS